MKRWILFACVLSSCGGGEEDEIEARAQQCEQVRDRLVDLRLSASHTLGKDYEQHRETMKQALGDGFLDSCARSISGGQATCVLEAKDSQAAAECLTSEAMGTK
jgi:hypothetical protein